MSSPHNANPGGDPSTTADHNAPPSSSLSSSSLSLTPYQYWIRRLFHTSFFHPVNRGLHNIQCLHEALGNVMNDPRRTILHVAGTNGKGSVVIKLAHTLRLAHPGKKVGVFLSPHVSSFRERMQVNGELISEAEVVRLLPRIYALCVQLDIPGTFFEITTALAFSFFAERDVDVVVLETGLGGRLDATNVVTDPALCIITSIGLDHTEILGDTKEAIAREKGGIIKPNCPILVGPNVPLEVLRDCARERRASAFFTADEVLLELGEKKPTDNKELNGDYDAENNRIVTAALHILRTSRPPLLEGVTQDVISEGIQIRPPCRFEQVATDPIVILDVAHNPPAMKYLVQKLEKTYPSSSFRVVLGMSSGKDFQSCAEILFPVVKRRATQIHLVETKHPRAAKLEDLEPIFTSSSESPHCDRNDRSVTRQVLEARTLAQEEAEILVICGSVFLMAEARHALGIDEPRDSPRISEGPRPPYEIFGNTPLEQPLNS